jgi:hypothetical protein
MRDAVGRMGYKKEFDGLDDVRCRHDEGKGPMEILRTI